MVCNGCHCCQEEENLLCEMIGKPLHIKKSKMVAREKFESDNLISFLFIFLFYPLSGKIWNLGLITNIVK